MSNEDEYIIAITGHRDYPDRAALYRGLDGMKADHYYFGGARGIDSDALEHISRTQSDAVRTVVVPNRVADQPLAAQTSIKRYATNVIELNNSGPDRYMIRNKYMVDNSKEVRAFYDFRGKGGTHNTIEYARLTGKPYTVQPMVDLDYQKFMDMPKPEFDSWVKHMKHYHVQLRSIKGIILGALKNIYRISVGEFCEGLGYPGCRNLEQLWER